MKKIVFFLSIFVSSYAAAVNLSCETDTEKFIVSIDTLLEKFSVENNGKVKFGRGLTKSARHYSFSYFQDNISYSFLINRENLSFSVELKSKNKIKLTGQCSKYVAKPVI